MDNVIEKIVRNNPKLDGADVITTTITREDRTKRHYYIFKKREEDLEHRYAHIPLNVFSRENGKGLFISFSSILKPIVSGSPITASLPSM